LKQKSSLQRFLLDSKKYLYLLFLFICLSTLAGIFQTTLSKLYGEMVDLGIMGQTDRMFSLVLPIALLLLLDFGRVALNNIVNAIGTERVFFNMRMRVYKSLLHVDMHILDQNTRTGDLTVRITNDINNLCSLCADTFSWFLRIILMAAVAFVFCFMLSWQMTVIYLILTPLCVFLSRNISAAVEKKQKEQSERIGQAMNVTTDFLHGLMVVKAFVLEDEMNKRFMKQSDEAVHASIGIEKIAVRLNAARYLFKIFPILGMLGLGLWLISLHITTVGTVIAFISISTHIRTAIDLTGNMARTVRSASAMAARIYEVLDFPLESHGTVFSYSRDKYIVHIENIDFSYNKNHPLFQKLSLRIAYGEKVGLVGPSGCGKSSIIRLISRLYTPESGTLQVFGHDVEQWAPDALRNGISVVTQEPNLFDGTIYENVAYGRKGATYTEIVAALEAAYLTDFILSLPKGMETNIGEGGAQLSGGQKQRIAIARAMLKNAPLVLLDEATASLDTIAEFDVQRALERLLEGRTGIIVTHRLYTLRNVDRILFLEEGSIVEEGTWDELMAAHGRFYRMALLQKQERASDNG
jgi:ABC-type multidrug transport system fused ATPase/permease subunit